MKLLSVFLTTVLLVPVISFTSQQGTSSAAGEISAVDCALNLGGTNSFVKTSGTNVRLVTTDDFSIEVWVKSIGTRSTSTNRTIFSQNAGTSSRIYLILNDGLDQIQYAWGGSETGIALKPCLIPDWEAQ